jgi:small subunit ribosomal protein S13
VFINGFSFTEATLVKRSLESFFGIGASVSQRLMAKFYIHPWAKVGSLKNSTVMDLTAELANMKIENDLRRQVQDDIRRLRDMGTYRGRRHAMGLPVRGQKTRTQVCVISDWYKDWLLTIIPDFDRTTVKQDGARWYWTGVDVR